MTGDSTSSTQRAAVYVERSRSETWSDADQVELDAWLAESTSHRIAYLRLYAAATQAKELFALRQPARIHNAADNAARRTWWRFTVPLLAASFVLAALFGGRFVASLLQPPDRTYSTDVGGRTTIRFADGTEVDLNTDTSLRVRMTTAERTIWLDKGEAWFHVAHDAAKPFTLVAGQHRVMDMGTEFLVRRDDRNIEVALFNGRAMLKTPSAATTMLKPGDDAIATSASVSVTQKAPQELADELAWRRGMLVFHNKRLDEVVQEINRYNLVKLVIADPSVAGIKVSTELRACDYEGFVHIAEMVLNLRVDRKGGEILISRNIRGDTNRAAHARRG